MEVTATRLRLTPLARRGSDPLPKISFAKTQSDSKQLNGNEADETGSISSVESDVTSLPEVVYGMMPRMAWMYR